MKDEKKKKYKKFLLSEELPDSFKKELLQSVWQWRYSTSTEVVYVKNK